MQAHDAHGGRGREIVRVDQLQQTLRETRKLRVHLELNAPRQQGETFQQPLHIRVGHLQALHAQTAGDLGMFLRKLLAQFADVGQFAVVIVEQTRVHQLSPIWSSKVTEPVSRSMLDLSSISIG
ncbi:hypothetical protein SDC9_130460 [bioreactor metagenome]|uniref:Uncharacterized protein n=1 Tax=bioreactor metagenome TaxID=1076179 RepID=A0A645D202_9ZZZZ